MTGAVHTPGQIGIADISYRQDGYSVCRIVKPNKLGGIWTLEVWERGWRDEEHSFSAPCRRKVCRFYPIGDADPAEIHQTISDKIEALWVAKRDMEKRYHEEVRALAQGGTQ